MGLEGEPAKVCPECGAVWADGPTCTDHFHTLGFRELDHRLYDVHHLMVLCYHIQHPSLYSPEGLAQAHGLLVIFLEQDVSPQTVRQQITGPMDSGVRTHKIAGTLEAHGRYAQPVVWSMRVGDVAAAGIEHYYASVRAWARAVLDDLRRSGNMG